MSYQVLLLKKLADTGIRYLMDHGCDVIISSGKTEEDFIRDMKNCDGLFVRNEKITGHMMDMAPNLKVIAKHGIGYDNIDIEAATQRNIQVVYAPMGNVNSVAEHAMMLILASAKRYGVVNQEMKRGNYEIRYTLPDGYEVKNKTLGLIGCGNIAKALARKAYFGLDMRVIGYDPYQKPGFNEAGIEILESREEVIRRSDFISIHLPSTNATKNSFGMAEFKLMKPTAYLINTSRGDIVIEEELAEALKKSIIKGAGLDVYNTEPVKVDNPLLSMPDVIATPHSAGMTVEASDALSLTGAQGIVEALYGKKITWPVNRILVDKA